MCILNVNLTWSPNDQNKGFKASVENEAVIVVTNEMTPNRAKSETKGIPAMAHPLNINIAPTIPN